MKGGADVKIARKIVKYVMFVLGLFFILMSFDVFESTQYTFLEKIGGFLIHSLPGTLLILVVILLWKKELILGIILMAAAIFFFILFKFYLDIGEKLVTILVVEVPLIIGGILLVIKDKAVENKE